MPLNFPVLGVIKKQAFQSSILLYVGTLIGFLTTGLITPHLLSQSEIGTIRLLLSYSAIFMSLGVLGFGTVTIRFLPRFFDSTTGKYNGFLGLSLIVGTVGFAVAWIIIEMIKPGVIENNLDKSPQFTKYFFLIFPLTIFQLFYSLFDNYNNALYRSSYGVFLRDFVQRIFILIGLALVFFQVFNFQSYLYYYAVSVCLPTLLILLHIIYHRVFDVGINFKFLTKPLMTSMFSVGMFGLLNSISNIAALQIDSIMINMYLDDTAVGIYVITFYFGTLVLIPSKALNKIAPSVIAKAFKEKDMETIRTIYFKSSQNLFMIGVLLFTGLWVNLDNIFYLIPRSYEEGRSVIMLIGLANLVKMAGGSNDSVIIYSKYFKVSTLILVFFTVMIVIFNFVFIPGFGITGAAIATLSAITVHNLIKFIFIKWKFGLNPYSFQYLLVMAASAFIALLVNFVPDTPNFIINIIKDSLLAVVLFYPLIRFLPMAVDLNQTVEQLIKSAGLFLRTKK